MTRQARRSIAAIAIVATLLNALVPFVSPAVAVASFGEICTAQGTVPGAAGKSAPAGEHGKPQHCPYCVPHAASFCAPPPPAWLIAAPAADTAAAPAGARAPATRAPWPAAQPRAPPFLG